MEEGESVGRSVPGKPASGNRAAVSARPGAVRQRVLSADSRRGRRVKKGGEFATERNLSLSRSVCVLCAHQADLDLGNYERFVDVTLTRDHNITTGKIYQVRSSTQLTCFLS